jgi:hypothetical protein
MYRRAFLTAAVGDQRQLSYVSSLVDAAAAPAGNAPRSGTAANALRGVERPAQQAPGCDRGSAADASDLVARARAILAEDAELLQVRHGAKRAPRGIR